MKRIQLTPAFQRLNRSRTCLTGLILLLTLLYFVGLLKVPFHPDESTTLFMSSDWEVLLSKPVSLAYQPGAPVDLKIQYRLIDPPLARYLVGLSRSVLHTPALTADWDWSISWQENSSRGALPSEIQLFTARLPTVLMFPLSLLLTWLITQKLSSKTAGWAALLLLASSSLVLLHTRRAMAESSLLLFSLLSLWIILRYPNRPWLAAIPLALAFNAKYSAAPLVLVGLVNIFWQPATTSFRKRLDNFGLFLLIFAGISFLLNPVLWADPIQSLQAAWSERQSLVNEQVSALASIRPDLVGGGWWQRVQFFLVQLFFAPPAIQDIGNYTVELRSVVESYLGNPLHRLWNGLAPGAFLFAMSIVGMLFSALKDHSTPNQVRGKIILLTATFLQFVGLGFLLSLPFQRYVLPLVPYICIWSGAAIGKLISFSKSKLTKKAA